MMNLTVKSLIQNYCSNFLSYLYLKNGWKRTMLDLAKENYIESMVKDNKIRIVVTSTGEILLTCYCMFDILIAMEFLEEQFEYGRMKSYLEDDSKMEISVNFETRVELKNSGFEKGFSTKYGEVIIKENVAILKYNSYEKGEKLIKIFRKVFFPKEKSKIVMKYEEKEEVEKEEKEEENSFDILLFSSFALWASSKIGQLFL